MTANLFVKALTNMIPTFYEVKSILGIFVTYLSEGLGFLDVKIWVFSSGDSRRCHGQSHCLKGFCAMLFVHSDAILATSELVCAVHT